MWIKLTRTSEECPSQWEGIDERGRPVYIRYRSGCLSIGRGEPGESIEAAVDMSIDRPLVYETLGDRLDGLLEFSDLLPHLQRIGYDVAEA